jgi:transposase
LHVALRVLIPGGAPLRLRADRATGLLRGVRPATVVETERKRLALDLVSDIRRDREIVAVKQRIAGAVAASGTTLLEVHGVGPIVAAIVLGHVGDARRFPTRDRFASYNGTAPIEASSGPRVRHRLNLRGNRQLNHALHLVAVTQIARDTPGRVYYERKTRGRQEQQGSAPLLEATDQRRGLAATPRRPRALLKAGPGGHIRDDSSTSVAGSTLNTGTSEQSLPDPTPTLRPADQPRPDARKTQTLDTKRLRSARRNGPPCHFADAPLAASANVSGVPVRHFGDAPLRRGYSSFRRLGAGAAPGLR